MANKRSTKRVKSGKRSTAKRSSGKLSWPLFVKKYAKTNNMKFGDALSNSGCKAAYHAQ